MKVFEAIQKMSDENRGIRLAPLCNIVSIDITRKGGEIKIGVDRQAAQDLMDDPDGVKFVGGLLLIDNEQLDKLLQEPYCEC
jgi:hypothetical protein